MTDARNRIAKLLEDIGISCGGAGISSAEIDGYCAGIKLVNDEIEKVLSFVFINLDGNNNLQYYQTMLGGNYDKNEIIKRLGETFGTYKKSDFENEFSKIGSGTYVIDENGIRFNSVDGADFKKLSEFIKNYVPASVDAGLSGNGLTFDEWASHGKSWKWFDESGLCFNILDSLRSDIIE